LVLGHHAVFRQGDKETRRQGDREIRRGGCRRHSFSLFLPVSLSPCLLVRSSWAWPAAGLVIGIGILAKYTMVLWLPSIALFLLTSPPHRCLLRRPRFWVMTMVAALCCLPILWWNMRHDWVTLRHVGGQAGLRNEASVRWLGPLSSLGVQCGLLLGFWFFAWVAALIAHRPTREPDAGVRYLWWMSVPMFVVFLAFSVRTNIEP